MTATMFPIIASDPRITALQGSTHDFWDVRTGQFVSASTLYIPFGCPDWGQDKKTGARNGLCTFCALPNAVMAYREAFYGGGVISNDDHIATFIATLRASLAERACHTLMIFNGGSFLVMPAEIQEGVVREIVNFPHIRRLVIESRAELITESRVALIHSILWQNGVALTIRIGIEAQDDHLRMQVLRKGHKREHLLKAVRVMRAYEVTSGGYILLNPAPGLDPQWAMDETVKTFDWVLGCDPGDLNMDEAYFCSTNVGPGTPLEAEWRAGRFSPATLWMVLAVLRRGIEKYSDRIHLLPFRDEPEFLAVPSNHAPQGIAQDLHDAAGCDAAFHAMLDNYRRTRNPRLLVVPQCSCKPLWA